MATFVEKTVEDKIEVVSDFRHVQVRTATWVEKDGEIIGGKQFHRHVVSAGDDYSNESPEVQGICQTVHTPEVVAAFEAHKAEQGPEVTTDGN